MRKYIKCSDADIIKASLRTNSATAAAALLGIKYDTYKKHAIRLGVFKTNKSGKNISKNRNYVFSLDEIFSGKHPQYQTNKLRIRLIKEGVKENKCERCGIYKWLDEEIRLELDHIDGNPYNHSLSNLRILCPNCHSLTPTHRGKNSRK